MHVIIETDRLILRTFTINDAALIYELNSDADVTRFTFDPVRDLAHARDILEHTILPQYALYNHGRWAVHEKAGLAFIGWCGLKSRPELREVDLGYRFRRSAWGKGYATEAAWAASGMDLTSFTYPGLPDAQFPKTPAPGGFWRNWACGISVTRWWTATPQRPIYWITRLSANNTTCITTPFNISETFRN